MKILKHFVQILIFSILFYVDTWNRIQFKFGNGHVTSAFQDEQKPKCPWHDSLIINVIRATLPLSL